MIAAELGRLFDEPPRDFGPTPLWWWSGGKVTRERLDWQLRRFAEGGDPQPRGDQSGARRPDLRREADDPAWFSEEWWDRFTDACRIARDLGTRHLVLRPDRVLRRQRPGRHHPSPPGGDRPSPCAPDGAGPSRCGTSPAARHRNPARRLRHARAAAADTGTDRVGGRAGSRPPRGWTVGSPSRPHGLRLPGPGTPSGLLLDAVHHEYDRRVPEYLGNVIAGSFQDELPAHQLLEPPLPRGVPRPPRLRPARPPARPVRTAGDRHAGARKIRADYYAVRAELTEEALFRPLAAWHDERGMLARLRPEPPRARRLPGPVDAALHRLLPHPPLVRRRRQRPPRRLQGPLLHGPPLRPRARLDRGVPLLRLGRHPGGHLRLAPAVPAQRRQPVQPARQLLRHRGRLVRVGAAVHRLAPALLAAVPRVLPGRRPDLLDHVLGHLQRRRGRPASHRHHAGPHPAGRARQALRRRHASARRHADVDETQRHYLDLCGTNNWLGPAVGALDRHRVSFDVIDDASVQRAEADDGRPCARSAYRTVVCCPATSVLETATAEADRTARRRRPGVAVGPSAARPPDSPVTTPSSVAGRASAAGAPYRRGGRGRPAGTAGNATGDVPLLVRRNGDDGVALVTGAFPNASRRRTVRAARPTTSTPPATPAPPPSRQGPRRRGRGLEPGERQRRPVVSPTPAAARPIEIDRKVPRRYWWSGARGRHPDRHRRHDDPAQQGRGADRRLDRGTGADPGQHLGRPGPTGRPRPGSTRALARRGRRRR